MECTNLCNYSKQHCEYCKKNYDVSSEFYRAQRPSNNNWVTGYLVKDKDGEIKGILNKANRFCELAWIVESTLEKVSQETIPEGITVRMNTAEMKQIENKLRENNAYVISSIDEKGHHVGRFKGFSVDANGDIIIEADIDGVSSTK